MNNFNQNNLDTNNIVKEQAIDEVKKGFSIIGLAFKNVFTYTWINFKIVLAFACLTFLISLFTVYNIALKNKQAEMTEEAISANVACISTTTTVTATQQQLIDQYFGDVKVNSTNYYSLSKRISSAQKIAVSNVTSKYLNLFYQDQKFTSDGSAPFYIYDPNFLTNNDYQEMKSRFGYDDIIIGEMPNDINEAVLAMNVIEDYGLNYQEILNKEVKIQIIGEDTPLFVGKVTGIIRKEFFDLVSHKNLIKPGIVLGYDHPLFKDKNHGTYHLYMLNDWILDKDIIKELSDANINYLGSALYDSIKNLNNVKILANNLYVIIGTALIIGLVLMILMMVSKNVKLFSRSSGILLTFGLERKKLYILLLIQLIIISVIAMPIALGLTVGGYYVINFLMKMMIKITLDVSFKRLFGMFFLSTFVVFAISLMFFLYTTYQMRGLTIKELLSSTLN